MVHHARPLISCNNGRLLGFTMVLLGVAMVLLGGCYGVAKWLLWWCY